MQKAEYKSNLAHKPPLRFPCSNGWSDLREHFLLPLPAREPKVRIDTLLLRWSSSTLFHLPKISIIRSPSISPSGLNISLLHQIRPRDSPNPGISSGRQRCPIASGDQIGPARSLAIRDHVSGARNLAEDGRGEALCRWILCPGVCPGWGCGSEFWS